MWNIVEIMNTMNIMNISNLMDIMAWTLKLSADTDLNIDIEIEREPELQRGNFRDKLLFAEISSTGSTCDFALRTKLAKLTSRDGRHVIQLYA